MTSQVNSVAERFTVYSHLGWFGRWKFRHFLKWVSNDEYSIRLLLAFEEKIWKGALSSWQVSRAIIHALTWYNQEDHSDRIANRLPHDRLSDLLQIVLFFLEKRQRLDYSYRDLFVNIIQAVDEFKKISSSNSKIRPDQFWLETVELFSNITLQWTNWYPYQSSNADRLLAYVRDIALKASDILVFTQFRLEAQKELLRGSFYMLGEKLGYLETIADKIRDEESFIKVFSEIIPEMGLGPVAGLMRSSANLQEFEINYRHASVEVKEWDKNYLHLFTQVENASELNQLFGFLNSLSHHPRMTRYIYYVQSQQQEPLSKQISGALLVHKRNVYDACSKKEWAKPSGYDPVMDDLIDKFEQNIVYTYLSSIWHTEIASRNILWEFNKFTEYVPYEMNTRNWTQDNEKTVNIGI